MDRQQDIQRPRISATGFFGSAALAVVVMATIPASAQTSSYQPATDNVYINWGALNGADISQAPARQSYGYAPAPMATGGLLMPGPVMPRSTLHVTPPKGSTGVTLRKPGTGPKMAAKPAAPAAAAPAPAPKIAAAPPPAPAQAAPPPAPAQAAPKQLAQKKAAPAPTPAPPPAPAPAKTVTASAPPPPPPPVSTGAPPPPPMPSEAAAIAPPAPPAASKPAEQASTSTATPADGPVKVVFNNDDTKLSADGQSALESVLEKLSAEEKSRVQLMAYAAGDDLTSSKARRISLSRALSVRSYLIEKGVRSTRIDVRALGDKSEGEPKNRVDVNVIER
ncbi:OmpA family protein [Thalassospiraceae bacterium LMO-JJ14]|nr:OmpA family protein [Thalassospiraceae bacterium LMO-JJ14]